MEKKLLSNQKPLDEIIWLKCEFLHLSYLKDNILCLGIHKCPAIRCEVPYQASSL